MQGSKTAVVMRRVVLVAWALSLFAADAHAHGGRFRGPGGMVPPGAGHSPRSMTFDDWPFWLHYNVEPIERRVREEPRPALKAETLERARAATLRLMSDAKAAGHQDTQSAAFLAFARMPRRDASDIELLKEGLEKRAKHKMYDVIVLEAAALSLGLLRRDDPAHQLDAATLDGVRQFLFGIFDDGDFQGRARAFAAIAIGMLGDQPTGDAAKTTARLFDRLDRDGYPYPDLYIGLLLALRSQPRSSITEPQREQLRAWMREHRRRSTPSTFTSVSASYIALALGSLGTEDDITPLLRRIGSRRGDRTIRRSAAVALGTLSRHVSAKGRSRIAKGLIDSHLKTRDLTTNNFALMSLGVLSAHAARTKAATFDAEAVDHLVEIARNGHYLNRPHAALALSLFLREAGNQARFAQRHKASIATLRMGLTTKKLDPRRQNAFAVALGIADDEASLPALAAILRDPKREHSLRGYAALALSYASKPPADIGSALEATVKERRNEWLRVLAASALSSFPSATSRALLLKELEEARSHVVKGEAGRALARMRDDQAVSQLIELAVDDGQQDLTRAVAISALGLACAREEPSPYAIVTAGGNYRASTDVVNELFSLL